MLLYCRNYSVSYVMVIDPSTCIKKGHKQKSITSGRLLSMDIFPDFYIKENMIFWEIIPSSISPGFETNDLTSSTVLYGKIIAHENVLCQL